MTLKSELLTFLSRIPSTETVSQRKALLAAVGFEQLGPRIIWGETAYAFFNELLELLRSEGQASLGSFLESLADQELNLVGWDDRQKLIEFSERVNALTPEAWRQQSWRIADVESLRNAPFILTQRDISTFTGRKTQLQQLEELLLKDGSSKICSIVGFSDAGGIGKSALACRFAKTNKDKFPDGIIGLRVDGKDINAVAREFAMICGEKLDAEDERDATTLMQEVFSHRRMLLIFDNAEDASIKKLCPGGTNCAVIVTTRRRNLSFSLDIDSARTIALPPLSEVDAIELLEKILGSDRVRDSLESSKRLVNLVGNLPLALQILGAALKEGFESIDDYTQALEEEKDELLEELQVEGDRDLNLKASLNLSLRHLSDSEVDFFSCLSICAAEGFIKQTAMAATDCKKNLKAGRYLRKLYNLSLLNYMDDGETRFVLHPLVRMYAEALAQERGMLFSAKERHANFFLDWLQSSELEDENAIANVAASLDDIILAAEWLQSRETETDQDKMKSYQFVLSLQPMFESYGYWYKAIALMEYFQVWAEQLQDWHAVVRYKMHEARYWSFADNLEQAEEVLIVAQNNLGKIDDLDARKRRQGKVLNVLAGVYQKQNRIEESIQVFKEQVLIDKETGNDRSLAIVYYRLGHLLMSEGVLEESKEYLEKGVSTAERLEDRSLFVQGLVSLGDWFQGQSEIEKAQEKWSQAVIFYRDLGHFKRAAGIAITRGGKMIQERALSEALKVLILVVDFHEEVESGSLASTLRRLSGDLYKQEAFEEALVATRAIIKLTRYTNLRECSIAYNRLGEILQSKGKIDQSEQAFKEEIEIARSRDDKTQVAIGLQSLIGLYLQEKREDEIQALVEEVIDIVNELGDCEASAITLSSLGGLLYKHKRLKQSLHAFLMSTSLQGYTKRSVLIVSLRALAGDLYRQKQNKEALQAVRAAISLCEGSNNQSQLSFLKNILGKILQSDGDFNGARQAFCEQIEIDRNYQDFKSEAVGLDFLGGLHRKVGNLEEAEKAFRAEAEVSKSIEDWKQREKALRSLVEVLLEQGKLRESIKVFEKRVSMAKKFNNLKGVAIYSFTFGSKLFKKKHFSESLNIFLFAVEFHKSFDSENLINSLRRLASTFQEQKSFRQGTCAACSAMKICLETEDKKNKKQFRATDRLLDNSLAGLGVEETANYCEEMLAKHPNHSGFLRLYEKARKDYSSVRTGIVLFVSRSRRDNYLWGKIRSNKGSQDIIFSERYIGSETALKLTKGTAVEVKVKESYSKLYAVQLTVIE